jgi:hypothetical protein
MEMKKVLIVYAATAIAVALTPIARAGTLNYNIDFSCSDGSGITTGSAALCSGSSPASGSALPIASWTEGPFTVSTSASAPGSGHGGAGGSWYFNPNQGNPLPSLTAAGSADLPNGGTSGNGGGSGEEVVVYDSTSTPFYLDSLDIKGSSSVTVIGRTGPNGNGVFLFTDTNDSSSFETIDASSFDQTAGHPDNDDAITFLQIDFTGGGVNYLDNIDVTETPEPDSLVLLGTGFGLLGLGVFLRRRHHEATRSTTAHPTAV